jgi:formylglycine-generating enzyme required for sulfatase activity
MTRAMYPRSHWLIFANASILLVAACSSGDDGKGSSVDPSLPGDVPGSMTHDPSTSTDPSMLPTLSCATGQKAPGVSNCGVKGDESCCVFDTVSGGTFLRDYDGVTHDTKSYPATVSSFVLDRYEVTVGRFRSFVAARIEGWSPPNGSGKHTHLNSGRGLIQDDGTPGGPYEQGWDGRWDPNLARTAAAFTENLSCSATYQTWTPDISGDETRPINCVSWFEAYAFCIWDGGFLPSQAEWTYAASGGNEQRTYPWANPSSSMSIDCTFANFGGDDPPTTGCVKGGATSVGKTPKGNGKWGSADLAGNLWEWAIDWSSGDFIACHDCADLEGTRSHKTARTIRGGSFSDSAEDVLASYGLGSAPDSRDHTIGFRCARSPRTK